MDQRIDHETFGILIILAGGDQLFVMLSDFYFVRLYQVFGQIIKHIMGHIENEGVPYDP